jgi:hypothetical protein
MFNEIKNEGTNIEIDAFCKFYQTILTGEFTAFF